MIALDTNIFVYLFDETDQRKQAIAEALVRRSVQERSAQISYQVVQETLNALGTKLPTPSTPEHSRAFLEEVLMPLWSVMPSAALYERAIDIKARTGLHFYDALVVAGALQGGCDRLLTEDLQHGQLYDGLRVENPFRP